MLKKHFILTVGLHFTLFAFGSPAGNSLEHFNCQTSSATHIIDTSYMLLESDTNFELKVKYAPGRIPIDPDPLNSVRTGDIDGIKKRSKIFERLPLEFSLKFEKKNCERLQKNSEFSWNCYIHTPGQLGTLNYKNIAFFLYSQSVTSAFTEYKVYNIGLEFGLSLLEIAGTKTESVTEGMNESQKKAFVRDMESMTINRSMVVAFENSDDAHSCYIADKSLYEK